MTACFHRRGCASTPASNPSGRPRQSRRWPGRSNAEAPANPGAVPADDRHQTGIWLFTYLWFTSFLIACGYETAYSLVIFGATFAVLSKAIPLASVGGFGTHEAGWAMGFMLVGYDFQAAILSGLAINILTLAASMLFGIPSLLLILSILRGRRQPDGQSDLS